MLHDIYIAELEVREVDAPAHPQQALAGLHLAIIIVIFMNTPLI